MFPTAISSLLDVPPYRFDEREGNILHENENHPLSHGSYGRQTFAYSQKDTT
jgi:hypothetical protein